MKNFRKTALTLSFITSLTTTSIYANTEMPVSDPFGPYVYIGGQVGAARTDWSDSNNSSNNMWFTNDSGAVFGAKMGYQATKRFGAEIGGFILPESDQTLWINDMTGVDGSVNSWVGYAALTLRMPLSKNDRFYLRGKVGPAYRNLQHSGTLYEEAGVEDGHCLTGILGASLNYAFGSKNKPWIVGVEYSNIFGSGDFWNSNGTINPDSAPAVQIIALTLSKAFKL